jgi:CBS domain-containing protein
MKARALMTADPRVVTLTDSVSAAATLMADLDVGLIPVVEDLDSRRLRGVITDRDITVRHTAKRHERDCPVREHMSGAPVVVAHQDEDMHAVLARMEANQVRRVPVVDDQQRVVGIIASADVALRLGATEPMEVERLFEAVSRPELLGV